MFFITEDITRLSKVTGKSITYSIKTTITAIFNIAFLTILINSHNSLDSINLLEMHFRNLEYWCIFLISLLKYLKHFIC